MLLPSSLLPLLALLPAAATALSLPTAAVRAPSCVPRLSGLAQTIRVGRDELAWKSVPPVGAAGSGGVKLAVLPKHPDDAFEFIIEREQGGFAVSAATSTPATCSFANSKLQHPLMASCTPSHSFRIICQDCDDHDDAASGCQLRLDPGSKSAHAGQCIEAGEGKQAKLSWGDCVTANKKGEVKGRDKERSLARQLFNISPS